LISAGIKQKNIQVSSNVSAIYSRANTVRYQIVLLDGGSGEEAVSDQNIDFENVENES